MPAICSSCRAGRQAGGAGQHPSHSMDAGAPAVLTGSVSELLLLLLSPIGPRSSRGCQSNVPHAGPYGARPAQAEPELSAQAAIPAVPLRWGTAWAGAAPAARPSACASGSSCPHCQGQGTGSWHSCLLHQQGASGSRASRNEHWRRPTWRLTGGAAHWQPWEVAVAACPTLR